MSCIAIRAEGLSKSYRLGLAGDAHPTLRDTIAGLPRRLRGTPGPRRSDFWALRDVSFEVHAGEVLGIVGPNGAGKSTLLKILARIVTPTRGRAVIHGRLGALLEIGTGFHHELTGRENIFLNGAILGMRRAEIAAKLDAIVDFGGVEKFLDTPLKRYSSGMYLRLAFAVAAHVEPDILVIDEVLAVGDAAFQRKCIARAQSIAEEGRTVLVVSHQLATVRSLCTRAIRIEGGTIRADGPTADVLADYLGEVERRATEDLATRTHRTGRGRVRIAELRVEGSGGGPQAAAPARIVFRLTGEPVPLDCSFTIFDELGNAVTSCDSSERSALDLVGDELSCEFLPLLLRPGRYRINAALRSRDGHYEDHVEGALVFDVGPGLLDGRPVTAHAGYGSMVMPHRWTTART